MAQIISNLATFTTYLRTKLGEPVINVELEDSQFEIAIQEAVEEFQRYNFGEGGYEDYMVLTLSAGVLEYDLSGSNIINAIDFSLTTAANGVNVLFSPLNIALGDFLRTTNLTGYGLTDFQIAMMFIEEVQNMFGVSFNVDFRPSQEKLIVTPTPDQSYVGLMHVYKKETSWNLYNNILVKQLALAKAKIQWGFILAKHTITLPGGGTISGKEIKDEGKEEEKQVLQQIKDESEVPGFWVA